MDTKLNFTSKEIYGDDLGRLHSHRGEFRLTTMEDVPLGRIVLASVSMLLAFYSFGVVVTKILYAWNLYRIRRNLQNVNVLMGRLFTSAAVYCFFESVRHLDAFTSECCFYCGLSCLCTLVSMFTVYDFRNPPSESAGKLLVTSGVLSIVASLYVLNTDEWMHTAPISFVSSLHVYIIGTSITSMHSMKQKYNRQRPRGGKTVTCEH